MSKEFKPTLMENLADYAQIFHDIAEGSDRQLRKKAAKEELDGIMGVAQMAQETEIEEIDKLFLEHHFRDRVLRMILNAGRDVPNQNYGNA